MVSKREIIQGLKREDLKSMGVRKLGIFGSFAKGKQTSKSDIDFIVKFDENTFDNYMSLYYLLKKLFKRKIDLVLEGNLKPELSYILKEAEYVEI